MLSHLLFIAIHTSQPKMPNKISKFLEKIRMIESSGGQNTNHPLMQSGIHAGQSAIGDYGLMPNTVQEILNNKLAAQHYGPDENVLGQMEDPEEMKDFLENQPRIQDKLARSLAAKVLSKQQGDEDKAAYAWNQGSNLTSQDISDDRLENSPYVQKFRQLKQLLGN